MSLPKVPVFILEPLQGAIDKAPLGADKRICAPFAVGHLTIVESLSWGMEFVSDLSFGKTDGPIFSFSTLDNLHS